MPAQTDESAESSTALADDLDAQAVDTAQDQQPDPVPADGAEDAQDAADKADQADAPANSQDEQPGPITDAVAFLTRKNKKTPPTEAPATEKAAQPEKGAKEAEKDKPKEAAETLTDEDKTLPARTQKRIKQLLDGQKAARGELDTFRAEYEQAKPLIEQGKAFEAVARKFDLGEDLKALEDEDVAGAIRFQGAARRLHAGKGSPADLNSVEAFYAQLDATRDALGIEAPSRIDVQALEKAIAKARDDFDVSDLEKIAASLKSTKAKPQVRTVADQPEQRQQQPDRAAAPQFPAADDTRYQAKAVNRLRADGVSDTKAYYSTQLLPRIFAELRATFPGQNPAQVFDSLSPQAKHDEVISAHDAIRKAAEAAKPKPQTKAPTPRPVASRPTSPGLSSGAPATSSASAIAHLAGD